MALEHMVVGMVVGTLACILARMAEGKVACTVVHMVAEGKVEGTLACTLAGKVVGMEGKVVGTLACILERMLAGKLVCRPVGKMACKLARTVVG
jgi:hypothetical protein